MPIVSVIIPAYNAEEFLEDSILSIVNQTFEEIEIILIDDCSSDKTWKLIQQHAEKDSRIKGYQNKHNLGIAGNRNKGVSLASGKYLVWQDADDISFPWRIEKQLNFMESNPEVGIVGGFLELFNNETTIGERQYPTEDRDLRRCIFRYSPIAQPAAMVRKAAIDKVGTYSLKYPPAEDLDMTFRIGEHYKLANIGEVLIRYRESDGNATFSNLRKMELSTLEIRKTFMRSSAYQVRAADIIYNLLHFVSVWIIPSKAKIKLFNAFRTTRNQ